MRLGSIIVGLACLAESRLAAADRFGDVNGGAWLHYELSGVHDVDRRMTEAKSSELVLAGVRLHGFIGNARVGLHLGLDLAAGSTLRAGGFAYDVALLPLGVAVRLGTTSVIALGTGIGASGAIGTLDDAVTLPVEATAELGGGRIRVLARARASFVAGAPGRQDGAPTTRLADELDATLGLRIGHHYESFGFPSGNGYFVGASYRELMGARFAGLVIGYSIDLATPRER
ncbi:MAG: alpha/beta hydrolase fold protein [Myxococcales bacterium]|nr:alpha/beta hydrolase fold protein [Myxococcales bacterium]